jgi:hypothetical protein
MEEAVLDVEGVPTNLGLAHELTSRVAAKTLETIAARLAGDCLSSRPAGEHPGNGLMSLAFSEACRQTGLTPVRENGDCGVELEYSILELRIAYTGVDRVALFTKKEIERHASCVVSSRLLDSESGEELASTQQEVVLADRFPYDLEPLLRSESYPFTAPELKEKDWSKYVEPFVATALITGLIYLFFSNQSSE